MTTQRPVRRRALDASPTVDVPLLRRNVGSTPPRTKFPANMRDPEPPPPRAGKVVASYS